jgi:hypothetical protein
VRDWRTWLTDNVAYARNELGLRDIEATCPAYIVIGRRASFDPKQAKTYRALSSEGTTVMSYDRLRDLILRDTPLRGAATVRTNHRNLAVLEKELNALRKKTSDD